MKVAPDPGHAPLRDAASRTTPSPNQAVGVVKTPPMWSVMCSRVRRARTRRAAELTGGGRSGPRADEQLIERRW